MPPAATPALTTHDGPYGPELWATPRPPEGARLVSYSELQSMDCWLKHHYQYGLRLKPVQRYVALQLGSAWDAFYNAWHAGTGESQVAPHPSVSALPPLALDPDLVAALSPLISGEDQLDMELALADADAELAREARKVDAELVDRDLPRPMDWDAQLAAMRTTVHGMALHYVARHGRDETTTLGVQVRFAVPLPSADGKGVSNKYFLHGVLDRLVQDGDQVWIVDAKLRMATIEDDYRESFERDPQLALYGWAMRQAGWNVVGGYIDASSAELPRVPQLKQQPETVYTDQVDADGKPIALTQPVPCPACDGIGQTGVGDDVVPTEECAKCDGQGVARFASGARKGEVKTTTVKRPAFYSGWENLTTLPVALHALQQHGLPADQYAAEVQHLEHVWRGDLDSRYHWTMDALPYLSSQLDRASLSARGVAGYLDSLPPVPNPSKMKCKYCNFKTVCPSLEPVDFIEGFTTAKQRQAASDARRQADAARDTLDAVAPVATSPVDALDAAFAAAPSLDIDTVF